MVVTLQRLSLDRHKRGLAGSCLSSNHSVRLPDGATLIAVPFQAFIGHLRPELFQLRGYRLVSVTFRIVSSPGHLGGSRFNALKENASYQLQVPGTVSNEACHVVESVIVVSTIRPITGGCAAKQSDFDGLALGWT